MIYEFPQNGVELLVFGDVAITSKPGSCSCGHFGMIFFLVRGRTYCPCCMPSNEKAPSECVD